MVLYLATVEVRISFAIGLFVTVWLQFVEHQFTFIAGGAGTQTVLSSVESAKDRQEIGQAPLYCFHDAELRFDKSFCRLVQTS